MGLISKIAHFKMESGSGYNLGHSLTSNSVANLFGTGGKDVNVLEEYSGFAWKCINIRAETLADQDLFIERQVGNKWVEDVNHEFNKVLEGGTTDVDQSELLEAHEKSMCLYGESFWYFSMGESFGRPMGVYLLDPRYVSIYVADNKVTGYVYSKNDERIVLDTTEVLHYFIHDPRSLFRGYGPMQAAGWFVRSSRYVNTYVNNFLENNAIPAGVIVAKGQVNDDDWKLFKTEWASKYSGIDNAGKTGFVRGSDLDFVKTGLSLGEVDFDKIKNSSRDDIMIMFGISKPMMAIFDSINYASSVTARQLFAVTVTSPSLRRLRRKMSKSVANWYGPEFRVGSTNPVPEDQSQKVDQYTKLTNIVFTVNEARAAFGQEPISGGEIINPKNVPVQTPKSLGKVTIRTKSKVEFDYESKESFRARTEALQKEYEDKVMNTASDLLVEQKKMVLAQIMPKKVVASDFNVQDEATKMSNEILPILFELAAAQGKMSLALVGDTNLSFELTSVMKHYISDSIAKALKDFNTETQEKVATAVTEGLDAGESINAIGKRIDLVYDDLIGKAGKAWRTERLTRTEVIKASNKISVSAYKQSGVVQKKEFFANPGCCEFCSALNGSIIGLDATYVPLDGVIQGVNGGTRANTYEAIDSPPVHPACRCTILPVLENN